MIDWIQSNYIVVLIIVLSLWLWSFFLGFDPDESSCLILLHSEECPTPTYLKNQVLCMASVDRLNTKAMLLGRHFNVQPNTLCVTCTSTIEEDIDHLFFFCPFAISCWNKLGIQWSVPMNTCDRILLRAQHSSIPFFMEVFFIYSSLGDLEHEKLKDLR